MAALHIQEGPDDLDVIICKGLQAEADVHPTQREEGLPFCPVTVEISRCRGSEKGFLTGGRGSVGGWAVTSG